MNRIEDQSKPDKLLALDTSTATMAIAVLQGGKVVGEKHMTAERNHSMNLVPCIQALINELGWSMQELDGIAVGQGPGSYTGVRIGVTVAKTMAWTLGIPLTGCSSLEALAYSGWLERQEDDQHQATMEAAKTVWLIPLMDARRGKVYTNMFEVNAGNDETAEIAGSQGVRLDGINGVWLPRGRDGIRHLDDWLTQIAGEIQQVEQHKRPDVIRFVGDIDGLRDRLTHSSFEGIDVQANVLSMRGRSVGRLAYASWLRAPQPGVHDVIPNYTQLAEAETKWLAGQKAKAGSLRRDQSQ